MGGVLLTQIRYGCTACSAEVRIHFFIVTKSGSSCADLSAHVGDSTFAGRAQRFSAITKILHDFSGSAFNGQHGSNLKDYIFRRGPAVEFAFQTNAYDFRHFSGESLACHHVNSVRATYTDGDHSHTSSIWSMRVSSDHHGTGDCIVFVHHLVNNAGTGFPKSHVVLHCGGSQEVIDFLIEVFCCDKVPVSAYMGLNQVVTMYRTWNCNLWQLSRHKLKDGHLSRCILHGDSIRVQNYIRYSALKLGIVRFVHMAIKDFFNGSQRAAKVLSGLFMVCF